MSISGTVDVVASAGVVASVDVETEQFSEMSIIV